VPRRAKKNSSTRYSACADVNEHDGFDGQPCPRLQVPLTAAQVTLGLRAHPLRNILRQNRTVATIHDSILQRVSLPARLAKRVLVLAETRKTSASRVLVDLIETGLRAKEAQHQRFFEITDQLAETSDPAERKRLQEELARMTFAE
jgi:predicted transcriptional regulator